MSIELTKAGEAVLQLLMAIPPNITGAEQMLSEGQLSAQEITKIGLRYTDECFCDAGDYFYEADLPRPEGITPGLHSTYIYEVVKLLLRYGLDPNGVYDSDNIMESLKYVDNEYLAADTLDLLLQAGGDLNLETDVGFPFLKTLTFDVFFDVIEQHDRQRFSSMVHFWMVAIGNDAKYFNDRDIIHLFREYNSDAVFDPRKLRNHRDYFFGITHGDKGFTISIYDRKTLWEVARID